jgi:hypothetical protein
MNVTTNTIKLKSPIGIGSLIINSKTTPSGAAVISKGNNKYEVKIEKGVEYNIGYSN